MRAVVNSMVASPWGTSGDDGTATWPRWTKKSRKARRSSAPVLRELVGDNRGSPGTTRARSGAGRAGRAGATGRENIDGDAPKDQRRPRGNRAGAVIAPNAETGPQRAACAFALPAQVGSALPVSSRDLRLASTRGQ